MSKTLIKLDEGWRAYLDSLGANAGFVEGLIYQYLEDPAQVDERWRRTFDGVASGRKLNGGQPAVASGTRNARDHERLLCEACLTRKLRKDWTRQVRSSRFTAQRRRSLTTCRQVYPFQRPLRSGTFQSRSSMRIGA